MKPFDLVDWNRMAQEELLQGNLSSHLGRIHRHFEDYHRDFRPTDFESHWLRGMSKTVPFQPGDTVLDIGGGQGELASLLIKNGAQVTVVEPSVACHPTLSGSHIPFIAEEWLNIGELPEFDHLVCCRALGVVCLREQNHLDLLSGLGAMLATARKSLTIIMRNFRWFPPLEAELRRLDVSGFSKEPYLYPLPLLLQLNQTPDLRWFRWEEQRVYDDLEQMVSMEMQVEGQPALTLEEQDALVTYLHASVDQELEDGRIMRKIHWKNFVLQCGVDV